jgi:hypothetical protein
VGGTSSGLAREEGQQCFHAFNVKCLISAIDERDTGVPESPLGNGVLAGVSQPTSPNANISHWCRLWVFGLLLPCLRLAAFCL